MRIFAKNHVKLIDNQVNKNIPPPDVYDNGFIPATATQPGTPIVAQWFNYIFNTLTKCAPAAGRGKVIPSPGARLNVRNHVMWMLITTDDAGTAALTVGNTRTAKNGQIIAGDIKITISADGSMVADRDVDWMLICAEMDGL